MAIEKNKSMNEHVDRMKYLFKYSLNEAKYSLIDGIDEDDSIPDEIWTDPTPVSANDSNVMEDETNPEMSGEEQQPIEDPNQELEQPVSDEIPQETPPMPEPEQPSANELQNDILKSTISAMKKMNDELSGLELTLSTLNSKIDGLNKEVEEVKEPTNVEKLMSRKVDSHPFYYNLNDMWNGNSFQARRQVEDSEGMKKLDDGTYVADFDSLPKYTSQEVKDSF